MTVQPSYTAVETRRTLAKEPAPAAAPTKATQFPPAVVEYVQRAFFEFNRHKDEPAFSGITDADIRTKLQSVVKEAADSGITGDRDWSTYPLPHQLIVQERQQAALQSAQSAILANINKHNEAMRNAELLSSEANSKKRKSPDQDVFDENNQAVTPPWKRKDTKQVSIADRITGSTKKQNKKTKDNGKANGWFDKSQEALERRKQRFGRALSPDSPSDFVSSRDDSPAAGGQIGPIVGTCEVLEKNYFRLTAPPNPNTVRPLPVLEKALEHVIQKWRTTKDYTYVCDQFKSLRQDLTVQRIKNKFTIRVYEVHARIALEKKDLGEYNQCQTQLRVLYRMKLGENGGSGGHQDEFTAYRILYLLYTRSRVDMNNMLADLTTADKKGPYVQHALKVRSALASGNYHKFFKLYDEANDRAMVPYLMDMFVERERLAAMAVISRAYKPDISSKFLAKELAFSVDDEESVFEADHIRNCLDFITRYGGQTLLEEKNEDMRVNTGKAGNLFEVAKQSAFGRVDIKGQI
ncbi:THP3-like C2A9.11c [Pseudocercospora fuligena]|uniref:THP3-like C2A9.11c n=1 Tax=Pseudocercospora fuligena TaxID=685502 RepID=A0A8H6VTQ7_9PEZI|nr:THP3-like C2A9.11c [Pseudocercospora fuligena]